MHARIIFDLGCETCGDMKVSAHKTALKSQGSSLADKITEYTETFGPAVSAAIGLQGDLEQALDGCTSSAGALTQRDLKSADLTMLEDAEANLLDLLDQVQLALGTLQEVLELRHDPKAVWPA